MIIIDFTSSAKIKVLLLSTLFVLIQFSSIFAQRPEGMGGGQQPNTQCKITGTILNAENNQPVEYANIVLFRAKDSTMVSGTITDTKGYFTMDKLPFGKFYATINFIGFGTQKVEGIILNPKAPEYSLGTVKFKPQAVKISEVTVTSEKKMLDYNLDKKVINVSENIATIGGTAVDIMQNIPSVTVDIDGNVTLRGSSNVTILVDGRPSGLTSLDQIPASMIEKVEIVTNPSAKYDPDGMSGIINIVLKKKRTLGYYGMASANIGTGNKYNGSVNLNYRQNKLNLFVNYDVRSFAMEGYSKTNRTSFLNDTASFLFQNQDFNRKGNFQNIKLGSDYFINSKNTLSASILYNTRAFISREQTSYFNKNYTYNLIDYYDNKSKSKNNNDGLEYSLNYKKTFDKPQQEWTTDLFYSNSNGENNINANQQLYNIDSTLANNTPSLKKTLTDAINQNITLQSDYVQPIGDGGRLETGYKYSYKNNDLNYSMDYYDYTTSDWLLDTISSNHYLYNEQIQAAYLIYSNTLKGFQYQVGLRGEYAQTISNQKTSNFKYTNNYLGIYPTIHLKYEFSEKQALQLSYSRRINRPSYRSLNPFINYSDPVNLSAGNPNLDPEYINSYELSHDLNWKATTLNSSIFYKQIDNIISSKTILNSDGTTLTSFDNLNSGISYGLEFILSQRIAKWWKANANYSYFRTTFYGNNINEAAKDGYSWNTKINTSITILKNLDIQVSFNYSAPIVTVSNSSEMRPFNSGGGQGKQKENYFADLGMKKEFFDGKLTADIRISDIFKSIKYDITTYGDNFTSSTIRRRESRVVFFGLSYKINGGLKQKNRKKSGDGSDDGEFM